jgi:hypothetical protein
MTRPAAHDPQLTPGEHAVILALGSFSFGFSMAFPAILGLDIGLSFDLSPFELDFFKSLQYFLPIISDFFWFAAVSNLRRYEIPAHSPFLVEFSPPCLSIPLWHSPSASL